MTADHSALGSGNGGSPTSAAAANFYNLGDAEKVKFSVKEAAETLAHLDNILSELDRLGAEVDDADGMVSLTLGFDGHLLDIRIADAIGKVMSNIDLENRLNRLFAAGTDGVNSQRSELWQESIQDIDL